MLYLTEPTTWSWEDRCYGDRRRFSSRRLSHSAWTLTWHSIGWDSENNTTIALFNNTLNTFLSMVMSKSEMFLLENKILRVIDGDWSETFYLQLYGVGHMVKDHSNREKGNLLPPLHGLLFPITSKGSFICNRQDTTYIAFVMSIGEHWLEWEVAQWVHHKGSIWWPHSITGLHLAPSYWLSFSDLSLLDSNISDTDISINKNVLSASLNK